MPGTLAAQITIPIVAFVVLAFWLALVYYADSHPYWKGRGPTRPQLTAQLPSQAAAAAAERDTVLRIPAQSTHSPEPAPAPEPAQGSPPVPGQRPPSQPAHPAGATAVTGRHRPPI
jgi:hypothetical protein